MLDDHPFALCLTHDVDRPYKTYQSVYYALAERRPYHLRALFGENPYWRFEDVMALEEDLGVRSAFYFLDEQSLFRDRPVREWVSPTSWKRYTGRYEVDDRRIASVVRELDAGGWEVGLHGSFESYRDPERIAVEKAAVERVLGDRVLGGRQHYLNLDVPGTWRAQAAAGLRYDSSLGSSTEVGFQHGYSICRPFDDAFVVFPLTAMEVAFPDVGGSSGRARAACEDLLDEAAANDAVMTVLWHVKMFSDRDFPGYPDLYRDLVAGALDRGAWVGPPGDLYQKIEHSHPART
jgi:peptidoglycan/xylan/chitin deacetylase (PgdA/CDA1 family)